MKELSLHILDVMENSVAANADCIGLHIKEDRKNNILNITIKDNGNGIPDDLIERVTDPFYTTRTTRRIGLGLSLFREASRRCGGEFHIDSKEGEGATVTASFRMDHIDRAPMGDIAGSISCMIMGNSEIEFYYCHEIDGKSFQIDTREIRKDLEGTPINNPVVINRITEIIRNFLEELSAEENKQEGT